MKGLLSRITRHPAAKWWAVFALFCALFFTIEWSVEAAGRRSDLADAIEDATALKIENYFRTPTPTGNIFDFEPGSVKTKVVDVAPILGPQYAGWDVRLRDVGGWVSVRAFPPPRAGRAFDWLALPSTRRAADQFRKIVLIVSAGVWSLGVCLLNVSGPWRRRLAVACLAACIMAAISWAANPVRAGLWSPPPLDWIGMCIIVGVLVALIALAVPPRRRWPSRPDRCVNCGYDLTGNISGVCPECGRPTPGEVRRRRHLELAPLAEAIEAAGHARTDDADCAAAAEPELA